MKLTGSYKIPTDKQTVWEALNNPDILQKCIPGCEEFKKNSDTSFTATATNKIGPFNASFTGEVELQDLNPPNSYTLVGQGNSPVGFASGEAKVALTEEGGQTILTYDVEANVGGKIAQVGSRLIDMTAKKMADIFFGKFTDEVSPAGLSAPKQSSSVTTTKFNKKIIYAVATLVSLSLILLAIY
ncbi:MAG: carbon monoxide dehydrogenase [alpha proteobacterium HIMB114]|jgi:carbon monoxide dehydrogenase subunit G|nr:MAG: carbon monoxide dehydrogenase [alpha proteobacterium HIMB114]|tara:strand:+ start:3446 stop:4000 length:555 start_codon:yes stop_codon:yes gene_type:complete